MLQIFSSPRYDFLGKRVYAYVLSGTLILASLVALWVQGLNFGVDFRGGTEIRIRFSESPDVAQLRSRLEGARLNDITLQRLGEKQDNEILLRLGGRELDDPGEDLGDVSKRVLDAVRMGGETWGQVEVRSLDYVGPSVGRELRNKAILAVVGSLIGILLYLTFRFETKYGLSAVVTVAHDGLVTLGLFAITQRPFDLTVVAALLTIVGYSLNDTIVNFDRVRENLRVRRMSAPLEQVMNRSLNETLSRSVVTSLTTLLVVVSLYVLGGERINNFAFALMVGVIVGTYSTIYISCPFVLLWDKMRSRRAG
ncbi:MAG: protein translocase subunit SecF [Acidobacteria bacterium]|nr:protein translocase subunit SecF [Acidobacteriota bacterium]